MSDSHEKYLRIKKRENDNHSAKWIKNRKEQRRLATKRWRKRKENKQVYMNATYHAGAYRYILYYAKLNNLKNLAKCISLRIAMFKLPKSKHAQFIKDHDLLRNLYARYKSPKK